MDFSKLKLLGDRILIRPITEQEEKKGKIIIPTMVQKNSQIGEIVLVGTGKINKEGKRTPMNFKEGDRIIYPANCGMDIKGDDGIYYLLLMGDHMLAILK